jgi:putative addiction module component (TIGR02574 family)
MTKILGMAKRAIDYEKLSIAERLQLVEDIWDSIADETEALPLTDAQKAELDRRLEQHRRDPDSAIPWEQVREELSKPGG